MLGLIIRANFGVDKLRGFRNTRGQILEFPIEMAGHPYNSAALPRSLWWLRTRRHNRHVDEQNVWAAKIHRERRPSLLALHSLRYCAVSYASDVRHSKLFTVAAAAASDAIASMDHETS